MGDIARTEYMKFKLFVDSLWTSNSFPWGSTRKEGKHRGGKKIFIDKQVAPPKNFKVRTTWFESHRYSVGTSGRICAEPLLSPQTHLLSHLNNITVVQTHQDSEPNVSPGFKCFTLSLILEMSCDLEMSWWNGFKLVTIQTEKLFAKDIFCWFIFWKIIT